MAASKEFIESCTLNNNNNTLNLPSIQNEEFATSSRQESDDYDEKFDITDEKYSESTVDSPYSSVMGESLPEQAHSSFFPPTKKGSSNRSRRFKVSLFSFCLLLFYV